jgi:hypothetical protein
VYGDPLRTDAILYASSFGGFAKQKRRRDLRASDGRADRCAGEAGISPLLEKRRKNVLLERSVLASCGQTSNPSLDVEF